MITEAWNTLYTLGWAFLAWLTIVAAVVTLALYAVIAIVWGTARLAWHAIRRTAGAQREPDYEEAA
ncbi:hypothetical protein [Streptomyces pactum]|uniref:Uncharacterized protein n=1 Tax=Streptomyces pactum TaxID=68249 RepID=A0A1S6JGJ2_9ACTN|nr:hypothetical protein [Streptomyces pactum]AQS70870.1 hypothetical protein B1H29_31820 [Streptomyces pactum]